MQKEEEVQEEVDLEGVDNNEVLTGSTLQINHTQESRYVTESQKSEEELDAMCEGFD